MFFWAHHVPRWIMRKEELCGLYRPLSLSSSSSTSSSSSSATVRCRTWLPIRSSPFRPVSGHCVPAYFQYLQIIFKIISPWFPRSSFFLVLVLWSCNEEVKIRSSLFWDATQRTLVVIYRRFGTTCRSRLKGWSSPRRLKMGPIVFPKLPYINTNIRFVTPQNI